MYRGVFVGVGALVQYLWKKTKEVGLGRGRNWGVVQEQCLSQLTGKSGPSELSPVREEAFMFQHHGMQADPKGSVTLGKKALTLPGGNP